MQLLIVVNHSTWGAAKFEVKRKDGYIHFYYSSGEMMGWWDSTGHGSLGHPNEEIESLRRTMSGTEGFELWELFGDKSYEEYCAAINQQVKRLFPDFLSSQEESTVSY